MKKSRLLEIIREEISSVLNEVDIDKTAGAVVMKKTTQPADIKKVTSQGIDVELREDALEEDQLNEAPIYSVDDMPGFTSTLDKFKEKNVSKSKSLNVLLDKLKDDGTVDTNALSKEYGVDTATFNNSEIRKFLNRPEGEIFTDKKTGEDLIDFTPYLSKANKAKGKTAAPKATTEKPTPKPKTTPATQPEDTEDKEATQNVGSDSTAKELGATASAADKFVNLFNVKTAEEAKEKMKKLAKKANDGDVKAKAFFNNPKAKKIIQAYRKAQNVKI
jgi:hypothetical protein